MADELKNSAVISKKHSGFPDYLDFARLRSEGIEYLGKLAGQLWTDHNVHDPGITILEVLCYALLDLGYHTNLPEADILARPPDDTTPDNNFFTPARILACNPLTITDFRKLLVDIEGVKNAWLEPAEDVKDRCRPDRDIDDDCVDFLNGLYHVYIDLEKDLEGNFEEDEETKDIINRVKTALMAHRNLCEDVEDITILCKLPIGVCADIALEEEALAEKVYLAVVEALQNFFAPSPRFYTLPQLLDKQKPIEDIFAGRPYDVTQSHGFVDTEEFEKIRLRKEIHLSDVYHVILNVPGVQAVRNLQLRPCDSLPTSDWKFPIRKNHIPTFSPQCSGFRFSRNDQPLSLDTKKYEGILALTAGNNGKILYHTPSPYLDRAIPQGTYHSALSEYYSIQHEFPRVYGIEEGGLPHDAPPLRKAQALQLKGYLLFFDQLLANYLTQLSHIRSLFALSSPEDEAQQHTYFINQLGSVPELQKLLRFQASGVAVNTGLGTQGSILVFPVDKNELLAERENDRLKHLDLEQLEPYTFNSLTEQDTEISQLKDDLHHEAFRCEFVTKTDDCIFYYLLFSSSNIALISKKYFGTMQQAKEHATSVKYIGLFDENYRSFSDSSQRFSFTLELNLASFAKYLQLTMENRDMYRQRRQGFLRHLLARFAESFTDYALLSFGHFNNDQIEEANIKATERFLTHYDAISSQRGKAYDYRLNGWNNANVSGFEQRVKALTGMENRRRHSLCNFVVEPYDPQYTVNLRLANQDFFSVRETYYSPAEARQAAQALFAALADRTRYQARYIPHEQAYTLTLRQDEGTYATHAAFYATQEEADAAIEQLHRLFSGNPLVEEDIVISQHMYFLQLKNQKGEVLRTSAKRYNTEASVQSATNQLTTGVNDEKRWNTEQDAATLPGTLHRDPQAAEPQFIDLDAFKLDINDTVVGKPNAYTYDMLDSNNRFKIRPLAEFDDRQQARHHGLRLLARMAYLESYRIQPSAEPGFTLHITLDDGDEAVCDATFSDETEAERAQSEMLSIVRQHGYRLAVQEVPYRWKFNCHLGWDASERFSFESVDEYPSPEEARAAAVDFAEVTANLQLRKHQDGLRLVPIKTAKNISSVQLQQEDERRDIEQLREPINQRLAIQQEVNRLRESANPEDFAESVRMARAHNCEEEAYVYRLVDMDTVPAQYSEPLENTSEAEEKKKELARIHCEDYRYLEICQGGDTIRRRKDESSGAYTYHYLIKSQQPIGGLQKERVLLESSRGYTNEEEARQAFTENYLPLLEWASDAENYGNKISTEETLIPASDLRVRNESRAFVPQQTLRELGDTEADAIQALVAIARSYPIRGVTFPSKAFNALFSCEALPDLEEKDCPEIAPKKVYYFRLISPLAEDDSESSSYWQSTRWYATPEEAYRAFDFFRVLLCYRGNLFVDCDRCADQANRYRIYLREVLAESSRIFCSEADAWEGVEQFIAVSQSRRAFHNYQRKDGCYSFYLACGDSPVYHPCTYDTPRQRDGRMVQLYQRIQHYPDRAYTFLREESGDYRLLDGQAETFVRVRISYNEAYDVDDSHQEITYDQDRCSLLLRFLEEVKRKQYPEVNEENEIQIDYDGYTLTVRRDGKNDGEDDLKLWVSTLEAFADYFPVVKANGDSLYRLEIKLPGFVALSEQDDEAPCGCGEQPKEEPTACYVAWKSRDTFATCDEALEALQAMLPLLRHYENYRPLFDCDCYEFGIALHYGPGAEYVDPDQRFSAEAGAMIAHNPQCYTSPEMVCAAVERAWKLINSEGLHVVEHILLRPRCAEDCQCPSIDERCDDLTDGCAWAWSEPNGDSCAQRPDVCFVPGADPYSFIATVALPAWPVRFRTSESRQRLENILYREAPAHVLLRILWLAPHDFCCFEQHYQRWGRWLARKKNCREPFSYCDFLEFLFHRNFKCPDNDDPCSSPSENRPTDDFCFANDSEELTEEERFQDQVHRLYCWREQDCDAYKFMSCYPEPVIGREDNNVLLLATPAGEVAEGTVARLKSKPQLVNSRLTRYRSGAEQVLKEVPDHPLAMKVQSFLNDPQPAETRTVKLLSELARNEKSEGQILSQQQLLSLLQSSIGYYLDKVCFNGKDLKKIEALGGTLKELRQAGIDAEAIYRSWTPEEVQQYEPEVDVALIKAVIMGTN